MSKLTLLCGDFSMNRPGIAIITYDTDSSSISEVKTGALPQGEKLTHAEKLVCLYRWLSEWITGWIYETDTPRGVPDIFVRERHAPRGMWDAVAIGKVLGCADMFAMEFGKEFIEYAPSTIKKTLTGSGKAGKDKVATAVSEFTGVDHFEYDDESDACAVGITWLLKNGYQIEKRIEGDN